jgi:hypothetical protein
VAGRDDLMRITKDEGFKFKELEFDNQTQNDGS